MGPASENAGYVGGAGVALGGCMLQWVRRPRTPVMNDDADAFNPFGEASMGPASENAGYASMSFMVISQRVKSAVARGCRFGASFRPKLTSGIFITPCFQMR
jgi:hypothetical protein